MKIFFVSDTHYHHTNLVLGTSKWDDKSGCRPFSTLEEHDNHIVEQINKTVGEYDVLYHLGDWSFGGISNIFEFRKQIKCRNIHLILGNHDKHIEDFKLLPLEQRREFFDHYNYNQSSGIGVRNLFRTTAYYDLVYIPGIKFPITICHYAMRTWYANNKGAYNLYGHSHNTLPPIGKQLDVGLDSAKVLLGEYRPFSLEEIKSIMDTKEIYLPDGHTEKSNIR